MKIKIPLKEFQNSETCQCHNFDEYEIKIKCVKTKLHSRYLSIIAIGICIWQFAGNATEEQFVSQFSFASTITSIILSVLAIIMSITGEGKTEHIKEQLQEAAKNIDKTQKKIKEINDCIENNLKFLNMEVKNLHSEIEKLPETVAENVEEKFLKRSSTLEEIDISKAFDEVDNDSWLGE